MKPIGINQRVKHDGIEGYVVQIKEEYSFVADDFMTFISIDWEDGIFTRHLLTEFKRFGGPIEEIEN